MVYGPEMMQQRLSNKGRHGWNNWRPLIDDSLRAFAGRGEECRID
jgi:S-formylglutathione hydrolase FrmB